MYKEIIEKEKLNCTEIEFTDYINSLVIDTSELEKINPVVKEFSELCNWIQIENPANWKYYYILEITGRIFLQNIIPYIDWLNPINSYNLQEVINWHKNKIIEDYINTEKYKQAIDYFNNK